MIDDADVIIVGSGMAGAAVFRSLEASGLRVVVLEAGPALAAGQTHLRNLLPDDAQWRALLSAMLVPPVRAGAEPLQGVPAAGTADRVRPDQHADEVLPALGNCSATGGNALVWSGIVLPPEPPSGTVSTASMEELDEASAWLAARVVTGSPRQDWLQEAHGLAPVPLAWSPERGWHGAGELAGPRFAPWPMHAARRIVHRGGRATGVETGDRLIAARHVVVCAGVVGTIRLLWASGLDRDLPALGRGIAHHPVALAQVAMPAEAWSRMSQDPWIGRPAAVRELPAPEGGHTLVVAEAPWMADARVDARAVLSVYAYATLEDDSERRLTFDPEMPGPDGLPLPRFIVPRTPAVRACDARVLERAKTWAARLGTILPSGRPRVLPAGADQHLSGGARIGSADDPLAVADPSGRLHGLENVWIAGAAALPEPVSTHPSQTIVALAARAGRAVTASLLRC
ncbi:MAG TPA: GMC oxidoreductase [Thermoanaerobaculia bacterium]|nr:GMC oxidoreductase [Thermoanaerobaculia bacterium]